MAMKFYKMESETVQSILQSSKYSDDELQILDKIPDATKGATAAQNENERPGKRAKTLTSTCWKYFTKIGMKDGKEKAACNACGKEYVVGGSNIGTTSLNRHISKCSKNLDPKYQDVAGMIIDHAGKLRSRQIDHKRIREIISMAIIEHGLPYSFVEYKWIRELHSNLNPEVKHYCRNTAVADVTKVYNEQKDKLKMSLLKCRNRICLTSDCWTALTQEGYICLTAHFVDNNWNLTSKMLAFCRMEPPHTGYDMAQKILFCLKDWGIERKIFSITLDNASANDNMQNILIEQLGLQDGLLCDGEFFHIRCSAHILNLVVQEGLKVASGALHKIKESIKYVKASEARKKVFKECVDQVRMTPLETKVGLRMDVPTRWNSTFAMLESGLKYRRAFTRMTMNDNNYKCCPSSDEWKRGEKMCEFLRPFNTITNAFSGTSYPTSNLYFMNVWRIELLLRENVNSDDDVIRGMAEKMKAKFSKYWSEYSVILAIGAVFDPRMKFQALRFCYSKLDPNTCEEKIELVKRKLYRLFNEYSKQSVNDSVGSTTQTHASPILEEDLNDHSEAFDDYIDYMSQMENATGKSELDLYLDETPLEPKVHKKLDVLSYWKDRSSRYPNLTIMACEVLSIPITTVASESAFSMGARVLTKYRSTLLADNVQALLLTRNWLNGFNEEDADKENVEVDEESDKISFTIQESNQV